MSRVNPLVSFIVVNWNTRDYLRLCLQSIPFSCVRSSYEIIVVDNASIDGSATMVQTEFPQVILILNNRNLGYSVGCNQAVKISRGDYLAFLNPDVRLEASGADILVDFAEKRGDVGGVTGTLISEDGHRQRHFYRQLFSLIFIVINETALGRMWGTRLLRSRFESLSYVDDRLFETAFSVFFVGTSCIVIPRRVVSKLGYLFDDKFPLYWGDVDLCTRLGKMGLRLYVLPEVKILHRRGASVPLLSESRLNILFFGGLLKYCHMHEGWIRSLILRALITSTLVLEMLVMCVSPARRLSGQWRSDIAWRKALLIRWLTWPANPDLSSYLPSRPQESSGLERQ
jgi:GT2 family glycosyltransferase